MIKIKGSQKGIIALLLGRWVAASDCFSSPLEVRNPTRRAIMNAEIMCNTLQEKWIEKY